MIDYRVIVLAEAFSDLEKILDYIAEASPQNAAAMTDHLWKSIHSLSRFPHGYPIHRRRIDPEKTVRGMPVPPYIGFYREDEDRHVVRIATVRHGHRRKPKI